MPRPRKRDEVIEAATAVFLDAGFENASVDEIARRGGVSKRTVYNNFESKDALFAAVVDRLWGSLRFETDGLSQVDRPVDEVLCEVARYTFTTLTEPRVLGLLRLVIAESPRYPELAEMFFRQGKGPVFRSLSVYLARLDGAGRLRVPDPELAAFQFLGMFKEALVWPRLLGVRAPLDTSREQVIEEAVHTFLARYARNQASPQ
ncbi:TetR/AcrR family transcriptional regulator [Arhodomonas sp. AD133]|uniref:TetR/AcrR family transcriptional regulator n=1 Tax=Arhodomonas sp. AD133 TaxID=3415009 RepID=UPI003EBF1950